MNSGLLTKIKTVGVTMFLVLGMLFVYSGTAAASPKALVMKPFKQLSEESKECAACHKDKNPSIYTQWGRSKHYGANVGCYECHQASPTEPDAIEHEGYNIAVIVSPKDCGSCHSQEVEEFSSSHHAKAGRLSVHWIISWLRL